LTAELIVSRDRRGTTSVVITLFQVTTTTTAPSTAQTAFTPRMVSGRSPCGEHLAAARHNGRMPLDPQVAARLKRDGQGLFPAVAQQHGSREVLMVGWMDDEALHRTLTTGRCTYWSRSRQEYWVKGETSGHVQRVRSVALDCDGDTVLVTVDQVGGACHTGDRTCFDADVLLAERADGG
jgi:phosphoribosyl-AMP cyclohydrolase